MGHGFPVTAMQGREFQMVSIHGGVVPIVLTVGAGVSVRGVGIVAEAGGVSGGGQSGERGNSGSKKMS
jgi:hypothetical protein